MILFFVMDISNVLYYFDSVLIGAEQNTIILFIRTMNGRKTQILCGEESSVRVWTHNKYILSDYTTDRRMTTNSAANTRHRPNENSIHLWWLQIQSHHIIPFT